MCVVRLFMCVCVSVCERERERKRDDEFEKSVSQHFSIKNFWVVSPVAGYDAGVVG